MKETERRRLRQLVRELTRGGRDLAGLPRSKTDLAGKLRELGRDGEARRIEYGAGFSFYAGEGEDGVVWIISGARREPLFDDGEPEA